MDVKLKAVETRERGEQKEEKTTEASVWGVETKLRRWCRRKSSNLIKTFQKHSHSKHGSVPQSFLDPPCHHRTWCQTGISWFRPVSDGHPPPVQNPTDSKMRSNNLISFHVSRSSPVCVGASNQPFQALLKWATRALVVFLSS